MLVDKLPEGITMQLYLHRNVPDKLPGKIIFSSSQSVKFLLRVENTGRLYYLV